MPRPIARHPHRHGLGRHRRAARRGRVRRQGSNTLGNIARAGAARVPTLRSLGLARLVDIGAPTPDAARRVRAAWRRRRPGKDSVTGHWEMMGIVLDRPFPTFPHGFPPELIAEFERRIGRTTLGNIVGVGHRDHRRARPRAHAHRLADRLHVGRQRVSDRRARGGDSDRRAVPRSAASRSSSSARGLGVGRVIARPFVGDARALHAHRPTAAISRSSPSASTLLDRLKAAGHARRRHRQDRGSVRRPRPDARHAHDVATTHGMDVVDARDGATSIAGSIFANLVDFDTLYGHRNDVAGLRRQSRALRRAARRRCCRGCAPTDLLDRHRRSRQRSDDAVDRSLARVRAAADCRRAGAGATSISARGRRSPISARRSRDLFGVPPLAHGTSFLARHPAIDSGAACASAMSTIREQLEARELEFLAPRSRQERREPRPAAARAATIRSGPCSSAIAIASSTRRRSGG